MKWTKEAPKVLGYYWYRRVASRGSIFDVKPTVVEVYMDSYGHMYIRRCGSDEDGCVGVYPNEEMWAGPLTPPEEM